MTQPSDRWTSFLKIAGLGKYAKAWLSRLRQPLGHCGYLDMALPAIFILIM